MMNATLSGKPDAGNPHVRFGEGEVAPAEPRRGSLLSDSLCPTRRTFIRTGAAALTATAFDPFGFAATEERPLLRIGAISDDHLHPDRPKTHARARACFELFRRMGADIVVDTGDIADLSHVSELEWFRRTFDETFAGTACVPFFCIANHDYNYVPNTAYNDPTNIENAWRALKMDSANPKAVVKGYRFVNVFQNEKDPELFEKTVAEAVAANEGNRPVFVVNHEPPFGTTLGTEHWSSRKIRTVLNRYPQVVALTGHIHTALTWAANIWQGEFTSLSLGAHAEYSNPIDGECSVLDVFTDRIAVRRFEAVSGREIGADDRWVIPLPLDPANGPYRTDVRRASAPRAELPASVQASFAVGKDPLAGTFAFTAALPRGKARRYDIRFESRDASGKWNFLATLNWCPPQVMDEPAAWKCPVTPCLFDPGCKHRAVVTPVNCFDTAGKGVEARFAVPAAGYRELPAELTRVERIVAGDRLTADELALGADGWFRTKTWYTLLLLPVALSEAIAGKASVLRADLGYRQTGVANTISIGRFAAGSDSFELGIAGRIYTQRGECDTHRWTWTLPTRIRKGDRLAIVVREGSPSDFHLNGTKVFLS